MGFLLYPSMRSIAYLNIFLKNKCLPNEIIILSNDNEPTENIQKEAIIYDYNQQFFDTNLNIELILQKNKIDCHFVSQNNINHPEILDALKKCKNNYFIYSGGGILKKEILSLDKKFIHIHPGKIPEFRGSTCFYYSLLKNYSLATTSFIMDEELDRGNILYSIEFSINYQLQAEQHYFIDYILDPYIRACNLNKILCDYIKNHALYSTQQENDHGDDYFVIHPLLRKLAAEKIRKNYNTSLPSGIEVI